jgi:hypothetical protein
MNSTTPDFRRARHIFACSALTLLFASAALGAFAQTSSAKRAAASPDSPEAQAVQVARSIKASFYHPDQLAGLDCTVAVDWDASFKGQNVPPETLKVLKGLQIKAHSPRFAEAHLSFDWTDGRMDNAEQVTEGLKMSLGGFLDVVYWPVIASPPVPFSAEINRIEAGANGVMTIYSTHKGNSVITTIDRQGTPSRVVSDSEEKKTIYDFQFSPSPNPEPGDQQRLSGLDVREHMGDTDTHMQFEFDYQKLDSYYIPRHVHAVLVGSNVLDFELTGCTVSATGQ